MMMACSSLNLSIESLDLKKQLIQDPFNFKAWKLHEQRTAQLHANEPDGFVKITIGNVKGWVTSYHLIEPKLNQLKRAWLKSNSSYSDI